MPRSEGDERLGSYKNEPPEPLETFDFVDRAYREPTGDDAFDLHIWRVRWWYAAHRQYEISCRQTNRRPHVAS